MARNVVCYNALMQFARKAGLFLAATLLPITLFSLGLGFSIYQVFGQPDRIKQALQTSGIYDTFVGDALTQATKEGDAPTEEIPTDRPEVQQIIKDAASPEFLKTQTEGFLDGMYAWVQGETQQLRIEINMAETKTKLVDGLTQYTANRLATLPPCTAPVDPATFDALNADCLPPGVDPAAGAAQVRAEIEREFFEDPILTQNDIKNDAGEPLQKQLEVIPNIYSQLVTWLWVSGVMVLVLAAGIVLLSRPWRAGLKRAGIIFISIGGLSSLMAIASAFLFKQLADSLAGDGTMQASVAKVCSLLANDFRAWWLGYGIILLVSGIGALVALRFIKPGKELENSETDTQESKTTAKPPIHEPRTPAKPTPQ